MTLPRLSAALVAREEKRHPNQRSAWYALAKQGYLPGEIAAHANRYPPDVAAAIRHHAATNNLPVPASAASKRTCSESQLQRAHRLTTDWRLAFRSQVCRTGLALNLTQPMLEYLCAKADGVQWDRTTYRGLGGDDRVRPDNFISTEAALVKRGLYFGKDLTDAGRLLVEILVLVGLFQRADASTVERSNGKRRRA